MKKVKLILNFRRGQTIQTQNEHLIRWYLKLFIFMISQINKHFLKAL